MGQYSIKELEKLSGIKAHTIRIWEKRYGIIEPQRTQTNIRYYSDEDLKHILNLSLLNHYGHKISKIARLSQELVKKIEEHALFENDYQYYIDRFVVAMIDMNEEGFENCLDECIISYGIEKTMIEILYPFFAKVGTLWVTGSINPGQEHLISNIVRNKLILAIERKSWRNKEARRTAMFVLPENEWHELGLLFHQWVALECGLKTIYLGQSVPFKTLEAALKLKLCDFIITSHLSARDPERLNAYLVKLSDCAPNARVVIIDKTIAVSTLITTKKYQAIKDINEFKKILTS